LKLILSEKIRLGGPSTGFISGRAKKLGSISGEIIYMTGKELLSAYLNIWARSKAV
jgi:hypothetical protein